MKKKKKNYIWWLTAALVFFFGLSKFEIQTVSAMAMRNTGYFENQTDGRMAGKEKQLLANSYSGEYEIEFSYGFDGKYQDGNHVPVSVAISNKSSVAFEGYFVFQVKNDTSSVYVESSGSSILGKLFPGVQKSEDTRNHLFQYRFPIQIPANSTITKTFSAGLMTENVSYCDLILENGRKDTVYSRREIISNENFFHSAIQVCVIEEDTDYGRQLNGITLNDGIYEVEAGSARVEELKNLVDSYAPDVLILLEQQKEDLDQNIRQEINKWQAEGGMLVCLAGTDAYSLEQQNAFKEAPAEFLKNILDEDTVGQLTAKRNANYQKYYTIGDLLENTKVRNRPNVLLYGVLILVYVVLGGPGLYFILKKTGKRRYLWGAVCSCSACFLLLISLFGKNTQLNAPVLTYLRETWQYKEYQKESIHFCAQAPYNASYELYLDPSYDLVTYNRMDYISSNETDAEKESDAYEKTEIDFGEQKNKVKLSQMAAFCLNEFGMQKTETLEEKEGLQSDLQFWDQTVSGTVRNGTKNDLENCVLVLPGYCVWIGDLDRGEEKKLEQETADSVRSIGNWSRLKNLPEVERNYLTGVIYNHMPNRSKECLLFGKIKGEDSSFQMESGYEAYGISYYFADAAVNMIQDDIVYCPYAQEYSGWDGVSLNFEMGPDSGGISDEETEVTYYLNAVFENNNIWQLYREYREQCAGENTSFLTEPDFWTRAMHTMQERIWEAESGAGEKRGQILSLTFEKAVSEEEASSNAQNFDGTIELYNYKKETYEELTDWKIDFSKQPELREAYVNDQNQVRVRYRLSKQTQEEEYHQKYGYYEAPNLIVKAEKLPVDTYLEKLFSEGSNADTEN